tara:strand:- start:43 stop:522 length:480 start_codon:yes stop_codon:yes gene_type:complete
MINYENSKIYKLTNTTTNQIYVGSTTRDLKTRYREHLSRYKTKTNRIKSYLLFNDTDNVIIELLENVNCKNKKELHDRELHYIQSLECINKYNPTRDNKQYYQETKKALINYHNNKEEINKKRLEKITCECGAIVSKAGLGRHKKTIQHIKLTECIILD